MSISLLDVTPQPRVQLLDAAPRPRVQLLVGTSSEGGSEGTSGVLDFSDAANSGLLVLFLEDF